jgi:hypothetical protein
MLKRYINPKDKDDNKRKKDEKKDEKRYTGMKNKRQNEIPRPSSKRDEAQLKYPTDGAQNASLAPSRSFRC